MRFERFVRNGCGVVRVLDNVRPDTDLTPLLEHVKTCLAEGAGSIALCFAPYSFFCSLSLGVLVRAVQLAQESGAKICLVRPNDSLKSVLQTTSLIEFFDTVESEEELVPA